MKVKQIIAFLCAAVLLWTVYPYNAHADREMISVNYIGTPSSSDLDDIDADIRYPRKESFYLDEYKFAKVSRNSVYAFKDPNAANVMAKGNTFNVYKGEQVVILAQSSGYACVIFPNLGCAGWINQDYLEYVDSLNLTKEPYFGPSSADLDAIDADIRYPRQDSFYLDDYKYAVVARNCVYAFKDPNVADVMAKGNTFFVYKGEEAIMLAQSSGYACVIFPNLGRAGWVNQDYLESVSSLNTSSSPEEPKYGPSAADLDAIDADIRYPRLDSFYLPDYIVTTVSRPRCHVFIDPNSSDVMNANNYFDVSKGEMVVILAESSGYACVIFPDLGRAGWINCDYLTES